MQIDLHELWNLAGLDVTCLKNDDSMEVVVWLVVEEGETTLAERGGACNHVFRLAADECPNLSPTTPPTTNSRVHKQSRSFLTTLIICSYGHYSQVINLQHDLHLRRRGSLLCKRRPPGHALRVEVRPLAQTNRSLPSAWAVVVVSRGVVH